MGESGAGKDAGNWLEPSLVVGKSILRPASGMATTTPGRPSFSAYSALSAVNDLANDQRRTTNDEVLK